MGVISAQGFIPVLGNAIQDSNINSGILPRGERIVDLHRMIEDQEIRAIFCCGDGNGNPGIPIVFDFPIGEGTPNIPLIEGAMVELEVTNELVALRSLSV